MLSVPLNIVSKIKDLPIVRRSLGRYSGEIALINSGGSRISTMAEQTWISAVDFRGYCERLLDRMSKSPLGTLAILFRSEPKASSSAKVSPEKQAAAEEGEQETLIILLLTAIFLICFDLRRQRARRRRQTEELNGGPPAVQ
jgi:hypothetical protein